MNYSPFILHIFRFMLFSIFVAYCAISGLVVNEIYEGFSLYGFRNPAYWLGSGISALVVLISLFSAYSQLILYNKNTLYCSVAWFGVLFTLYVASPVFEYLVSARHREILKNPSLANETFQRYSAYNPIDALTVDRTQADAKCCGYDNKRVWSLLGYDPAFPATTAFVDEKKRLYPAQCCERKVSPCSGNNVFDSGCKVISERQLREFDAKIQYRFNYTLTMCLAWIGVYLLHILIAYQYYDLLIGRFFQIESGYDGSNYY